METTLYRFVKASETNFLTKDCWVHTDKGYNWFFKGKFYTDTFYKTEVFPTEILEPLPKEDVVTECLTVLKQIKGVMPFHDGDFTEGESKAMLNCESLIIKIEKLLK